MKTALIFGITGQDGSYLAELLLEKGYRVVGVVRRVSVPTDSRIAHLKNNIGLELVEGDITDSGSVDQIIRRYDPQTQIFSDRFDPLHNRYEIYNLAAQSHVGTSFEQPILTTNADYLGPLNILEAVRRLRDNSRRIRIYQASSSEMFGSKYSYNFTGEGRCQSEATEFAPNSPYAVAKLAAHHLCRVYRDSYGMFVCCGILFNHESERRGEQFVTRKISLHVAAYAKAREQRSSIPLIQLGNLDPQRDWGHAEDYVFAMWLMMQTERPDDFVIATGETHSVYDFLVASFRVIGVDIVNRLHEFVKIDSNMRRPNEVPFLQGNANKARQALGWVPTIDFKTLVSRMVLSDCSKSGVQHG